MARDAAVIGFESSMLEPSKSPVDAVVTDAFGVSALLDDAGDPGGDNIGSSTSTVPMAWISERAPRTAASRGDSSGSCICSSNALASSIFETTIGVWDESLSPIRSAATRFASASSRASLAATSTSRDQKGDRMPGV